MKPAVRRKLARQIRAETRARFAGRREYLRRGGLVPVTDCMKKKGKTPSSVPTPPSVCTASGCGKDAIPLDGRTLCPAHEIERKRREQEEKEHADRSAWLLRGIARGWLKISEVPGSADTFKVEFASPEWLNRIAVLGAAVFGIAALLGRRSGGAT